MGGIDRRADGRTLAQIEGQGEWKPLASLPEFADLAIAPAPPKYAGAPPPIALPQNVQVFTASVLGSSQSLSIGACLKGGWELLKNNFGLLFSVTFVICMLRLTLSAIQVVNIVALFFKGVFYGGLYLVFLKRLRNQPATMADAFSGFGAAFVQLLLVGIITLPFDFRRLHVLYHSSGLYLYVALGSFAVPLVADKHLGFWDAMELSQAWVVTKHWLQIAAVAGDCHFFRCISASPFTWTSS